MVVLCWAPGVNQSCGQTRTTNENDGQIPKYTKACGKEDSGKSVALPDHPPRAAG